MKKLLVAVASVFVLVMAVFLSLSHAQTASLAVIPEEPPQLQQLFGMVSHPSEIDDATKALDIPARLVNVHLATPADLTDFNIGVGKAVHIPVAIADREGGRKSLYYLDPGEEVLAGFFVAGDSIVFRYLRRDTGVSVPAQTGDQYSIRLATRDGVTLYEDHGILTVVDPSRGVGEIKTTSSKTEVWVLWSCILVNRSESSSAK